MESTAGAQRTGKPKPPGQHGSPQLFSSLFQPWPGLQEVLDASRNKGHASQSREGAQGDSLFTQDHAPSDSRHQLSPLLQKIPSAPLRDQNLPSATREQLSPRSCASLPARIRRQPPPGILSEAQIFPQGGTVLFITDCLFVAQATQLPRELRLHLAPEQAFCGDAIRKNRSITSPQPGM